ncbi:MAG: UPF0149 family protein [Chlorobiaceae bacterium]|nr:UPF0149 family protein [Chlorobiaceae bacterium]
MVVYELRVTLLDAAPPVWRRVRVPGEYRLSMLHSVLQMVMGWENRHLHEFVAGEDGQQRRYGVADGDDAGAEVLDERQERLSGLVRELGDRFLYVYDFGDEWRHEVVLESVAETDGEGDDALLRCLDGAGACPPEDCGGVRGYCLLLDGLRDLTDREEHNAAVELLGEGFDPDAFDCGDFNEAVELAFSGDADEDDDPEEQEQLALVLELQKFLQSDTMPESAMSVIELDGLFAALAVYPVTVQPSAWLPLVWDMTGKGEQPKFASRAEAEGVMGLMFRYYNTVVQQLAGEPLEYIPLFEEVAADDEEELMLAAEDWAVGFMFGAMIDPEVWQRTREDDEGFGVMMPFLVLSGMLDDEVDDRSLAQMKEEYLDLLEERVRELGEFWRPWRQAYLARQGAGRTLRAEPLTGRNDPCPCGSGKKYKQCCGRCVYGDVSE